MAYIQFFLNFGFSNSLIKFRFSHKIAVTIKIVKDSKRFQIFNIYSNLPLLFMLITTDINFSAQTKIIEINTNFRQIKQIINKRKQCCREAKLENQKLNRQQCCQVSFLIY